MDQKISRLHAIIEGSVHGVGFRAFVFDQAVRLGLNGWVRNCWDGTVEVTVEGERANLEELLQALYRGPRSAHVEGVRVEWQEPTSEFSGFRVRQTQI